MIYTYSLPNHADPLALASGTAVVIDVLRATTTICTALANGCSYIVPCLAIESAIAAAEQITPKPILGGERGGVLIDGFDLGNSPAEYTAKQVAETPIVFTTTNGTKAMETCTHAQSTVLASFNNLTRVVDHCNATLSQGQDLHIICAGTNGRETEEDFLLAGAIASKLAMVNSPICHTTQAACNQWQRLQDGELDIFSVLLESKGGRNLQSIGLEGDIRLASEVDNSDVLPLLNHQSNRITG
ncbi:MAG: 2-phosphosulfolactate phosphatase [Pirellulaceae bacterium]